MPTDDHHYFTIANTETRLLAGIEQASESFARQRGLLCRQSLAPDLLARLVKASDSVSFVSNPVKGLGHRWIERPSRVGAAIELTLNRPVLVNWLRTVTGCSLEGKIEGRLVETRAGGTDQLDWHDDKIMNAQFGITLHLRERQYDGGAFELRDRMTRETLFRHDDPAPGDLVVFEVKRRSEHRVMPVQSGEARRVFTGWFISPSN